MCWYSFNPVYGLYSAHGFLPAWVASSRVLYLTRFFAETTQAPDRWDILNVGGSKAVAVPGGNFHHW
jgi:hypothetical protein